MIESLFLTSSRLVTFDQTRELTNASSFFFERDGHLFLVTSRHVMFDQASNHRPSHVQIELHVDAENMASAVGFSIALYQNGKPVWREGRDSAGAIDVAVIEIDRAALPDTAVYKAFKPEHLHGPHTPVPVGTSLLILGFPLGFHDTLHHMPVVRQAICASSFGLRFQGAGYFLTDARTHRGSSGAPVVMRTPGVDGAAPEFPWTLLGIHSARLDVGTRDLRLDEALGLNSAWYADILLTLTASPEFTR